MALLLARTESGDHPENHRIFAGSQDSQCITGVKVGVIPYRCDVMTGTYVDEFPLKNEIRPRAQVSFSTFDYAHSASRYRLRSGVDGTGAAGDVPHCQHRYRN